MGKTEPPLGLGCNEGLGVTKRAELTDGTIRELHRRLPTMRRELNARNYPVNEVDFREYAAIIAAEICKLMRLGL